MDKDVVEALTQPGHLVLVGLGGGFILGLMGFVWKWMFPKILAKELMNGAGKQIGAIVKAQIDASYIVQHEKLETILKERDARDDAKIQQSIAINEHHLKEAFEHHEQVEEMKTFLAIDASKKSTVSEFVGLLEKQDRKFDEHDKKLGELQRTVIAALSRP